MRNNTFLERLNDKKKNKNGEQTCNILNEYLKDQDKSIGMLSKFRLLRRLFFKQEESKKEFISENIDNILNKTSPSDFLKVLEELATNEETKDYLKNNLQLILTKTLSTNNARTLINDMPDIFNTIGSLYGTDFDEIKNRRMFIINNIDTIIYKIDKTSLLDHVQNFVGISNSIDVKINKMMDDYKDLIAEEMIRHMKQDVIDVRILSDEIEENKKMVLDMLKKYMNSENVRWIDIKKTTKKGRHKDIYQIGRKVLRIGGIKAKKEIPYSPRVLKPIETKQLVHGETPIGTIEITDAVDRFERTDLEGHGIYDGHGEEIYQLYKELRNANIVWIDAPHSLGFKRGAEKNQQNMIILDTDSLYNSEDTENLKKKPWSDYSKQFEERWKRERAEKLAKLHGTYNTEDHLK